MRRLLPILALLVLLAGSAGAQTTPRNLPAAGDRIVKLYPNPASTIINFELPREMERTHIIQVYTFMGKKVTDVQARATRTTLDVSEYNRGLYIYHLVEISTGKVVESGKFQVSH